MKRLLIIFLFFTFYGEAQKGDTVLRYFDATLNTASKEKAVFFGAAIRQPDGWAAFAVYPDTSYVFRAYFKDKALKVKEGPYTVYYGKNKPAVAGSYHNNSRVGVWRTWYENGNLQDSGFYNYNLRTGLWKTWYETGVLKEEIYFKTDSIAQQLQLRQALAFSATEVWGIKHGPYRSWYLDGRPEATGTYTNDEMSGRWTWYYDNGKPSTIEEYKNGMVTALQCFDSTGADLGSMCSITKPPLLRLYGDYKLYLQENLLWPKEALKKHIKGDVTVRFRVTKEGHLDKLDIKTNEPVLKKAVEEFFTTMTDWLPAISHNRVIDYDEQLTIPFYWN